MVEMPTTCGFCSCGCALYVEPDGQAIGALCPSATHPVSTGRLCIKGWNATPALLGASRLRTPLIRKDGKLQPASWEEAISATVDALKRVSSESGPAAIGVIGSAKTTNEECYSLVRLARGVIGTPNVDGACRFYDASLVPALLATTGLPASQVDINAVALAGSMLVVGANVMEQLAHIGSRIQDAAENGCKVVVADPRTTRIAPQATTFIRPNPGTDLIWVRALLKRIVERQIYVESAPGLLGWEELRSSLNGSDAGGLLEKTGVSAEEIDQIAEVLASNGPLIVMFGLGVLQQAGSSQLVKALADVAILLGGSVMPLRGQNNAQGACDMGLLSEYLPGCEPIADAGARKKWGTVWNCKLPAQAGKNAVQMLTPGAARDVKMLMVFGDNVALSAPSTEQILEALEKIDFLVVSDLYLTETAQLADVVFPACSFLEKDGTFTNIERRVQRVRKIFEPLGESRSDLAIISAIAEGLGGSISADPAEVFAQIASNVPGYGDVSYEELDKSWSDRLPSDQQARLAPIKESAAYSANGCPFRLIASRIHFHQQTGTMSARTPILSREYPETSAEMNESDVEKLRLKPGRPVRIRSKAGSVVRTLRLSEAIPAGCVHVPHYFGGDSPNALASLDCDPESGVPIYKGIGVEIEAIE